MRFNSLIDCNINIQGNEKTEKRSHCSTLSQIATINEKSLQLFSSWTSNILKKNIKPKPLQYAKQNYCKHIFFSEKPNNNLKKQTPVTKSVSLSIEITATESVLQEQQLGIQLAHQGKGHLSQQCPGVNKAVVFGSPHHACPNQTPR